MVQFITAYSIAIIVAESDSNFRITTDIPYLALTGELWGLCCEHFGENWHCIVCWALNILSYDVCSVTTVCFSHYINDVGMITLGLIPTQGTNPFLEQRLNILCRITDSTYILHCFPIITSHLHQTHPGELCCSRQSVSKNMWKIMYVLEWRIVSALTK